ncbi:MAG: hypothetical protein ACTSRW_01610 [Candidatus Helarchaeota archaeon]
MVLWLYVGIPFFAIFFLILGICAGIYLILHVEVGIRYSRRNTFIAAIITIICISVSIHFFMVFFGTGAI